MPRKKRRKIKSISRKGKSSPRAVSVHQTVLHSLRSELHLLRASRGGLLRKKQAISQGLQLAQQEEKKIQAKKAALFKIESALVEKLASTEGLIRSLDLQIEKTLSAEKDLQTR